MPGLDAQRKHSVVYLAQVVRRSHWLPPDYLPLVHVPSIGLDPPADPVLVYHNDSEKGSRPSVKPAREIHLIWRRKYTFSLITLICRAW